MIKIEDAVIALQQSFDDMMPEVISLMENANNQRFVIACLLGIISGMLLMKIFWDRMGR